MHKFEFKTEYLEQYFLELISGKRKAWYDKALIQFLFVASRFYRMGIQFRNWMYDKRVIRHHALGCLVVSIGNVSCGGTGGRSLCPHPQYDGQKCRHPEPRIPQ